MNCTNCGAPLDWQPGRPLLSCNHCGSFHRPLHEVHLTDRLAWRHDPGAHGCPQCRQPLEAAALDDFPAEGCRQCSGVLLADEVFAEAVRVRRANYQGAERTPSPISPDFMQRALDCPGCHAPMDAHPYYGPGNQVIDSCLACGLIWLDSGELVAIEQSPGRR
jgi:Zn-finger nucleic acid-binding protein